MAAFSTFLGSGVQMVWPCASMCRRRTSALENEGNTMQYLLLLYSEEGAWNKLPETVQVEGIKQYTAYGEALRKAGVYVGSNRLRDSVDGTRVSVADGKTKVQDGPY